MAIQILAFQGVARRETGLASGLINTSQEAGSALGVAVLSTVAASRIGRLSSEPAAASVSALHSGYRYALVFNAMLLLLALVVAVALLRELQ